MFIKHGALRALRRSPSDLDVTTLGSGGSDTDTLTGEIQTTDDTEVLVFDEAIPDGELWVLDTISVAQSKVSEFPDNFYIYRPQQTLLAAANVGADPRLVPADPVTWDAAGDVGTYTPEIAVSAGGHLQITIAGAVDEIWNWVAKVRITRIAVP